MKIRVNPWLQKAGYTFAEMMVVMAIIVLMMAILIPRFTGIQKGTNLKAGATQILSTLRTARRMAIQDMATYAAAFDLYSVPGRVGILKQIGAAWAEYVPYEPLPENIAIVSISPHGYSTMDVTRTDDNNLDRIEDTGATQPIYNPQIIPPGFPGAGTPGPNGLTNTVFRLVKFQPTGTGDGAIIYLWNTKENRGEIPNPTAAQTADYLPIGQTLANLHTLGVPPNLKLKFQPAPPPYHLQNDYFEVIQSGSPDDSYYYTLVVNPITGGVTIHDYAWGYGTPQWDRKKDGE